MVAGTTLDRDGPSLAVLCRAPLQALARPLGGGGVGGDQGLLLGDGLALVLEVLRRDEMLLDQILVAAQRAGRRRQLGGVLLLLGDGLIDCRLERARIDLCDHIAGLDLLAFLEIDPHELAVDPGLDSDRVGCLDRADRRRKWCPGQ